MTGLFLRVGVSGESYALAVADVLEVADFTGVAGVPGAPPAVLGVRNLRGAVLPIVDLATVLGLQSVASPERVVVVDQAGRTAGLAVDSVAGVEALPEAAEQTESAHLTGAALVDGGLVGVLELASVLDAAQGVPA
jgi:purine-binding chemotaxis protein CheW